MYSKKIFDYLNPIKRLGSGKYSFVFPLVFVLAIYILSEFFAYNIASDPNSVGIYIIFASVALIIYFAFRDGILGGLIATILTILYYVYIIKTRNHTGSQLQASITTTAILGGLYVLLALVIGWLKQTIDKLIERESNEKNRLQAVVQQLPVGVLITDDTGKIIQGNKQVETILGRSIRENLVAGEANIESSTHNGKAVKSTEWPIAQAFHKGKTVVGKEYALVRDDGKKIHVQISATPIKNKSGKVIAAASIINDITYQKEMEVRKDDFVNMASHELKTPLTSLKLYIDVLANNLKKTQDDRTTKTLTGIKYQTQRLQELVSDLLDVSRLQTGKLSFAKEEFAIDEVVSETLDGLKAATDGREVTFTSPKTKLPVCADKFRIYQVITNLITNAVKYSPKNSPIQVKLYKKDDSAVVSVKDLGIGIDKEQQKMVFDRLYQVSDPKEKTFPGLGMGLYISKEIIKRHKGSIWVESEKDKGSTFSFSLPLEKKSK